MFFGSLALDKAENAILAHTLKVGKKTFKKGKKVVFRRSITVAWGKDKDSHLRKT